MSHVPLVMNGFFLLTTFVAIGLFHRASGGSKNGLLISILWIITQSGIALSGFYLVIGALPPHLLLALAPPLLLIACLFLTTRGKRFLDAMNLKWCVLLHSVRVLVEINLFLLFQHGQAPKLLTFEGGNLDILVGLSAPLIWWVYRARRVSRRGLLIWNSIALLGVLNAVGRALLSAPFPFQRFGFEQPTVAILAFPFILLPAFIVPVVLLSHMVTFRKLFAK